MLKVTILFTPAVRADIRAAVAENGGDYVLPEQFDTKGQVFNNVIDAQVSNGSITLVLPPRKKGDLERLYGYPLHTVARYTIEDENVEADRLIPQFIY